MSETRVYLFVKRRKNPKYYLRQSFNYPEWFAICQVANNVVVAEFSNERIAEITLEFLNALPGSATGYIKV